MKSEGKKPGKCPEMLLEGEVGVQPYRRGRGSWSAVGGHSRHTRLHPEGENEVKVRHRALPWGGMKGRGHVLGRGSWEDRGGAECRVFSLKTSSLRAQVVGAAEAWLHGRDVTT